MKIKAIMLEALAEDMPDMSLFNCHHHGVDSIVLDYGDENSKAGKFMYRLFVAWHNIHNLDKLYNPDGSYVLGVHNHRYDLILEPIIGDIINHEVTLNNAYSFDPIYEFSFQNGIDGNMQLDFNREFCVDQVNNRELSPGYQCHMNSWEKHTVIVPKDTSCPMTVWAVHEGADKHSSMFYSKIKDPIVNTEGLYNPMPRSVAQGIVEEILHWL